MKNKILIFMLTNCFLSFSQNSKTEYENFKLNENKKLTWQKVYDFEASKDSITKIWKDFILKSSFLNSLKQNDIGFSGYSNFIKISDLKELAIAVHSDYNCFVEIEIKENKYRILISNVKFKPITIDTGMIEVESNFVLEDIVVRDNSHEIRKNSTARKTLFNLNKDFVELLNLKAKVKNDW